MTLGQLLAYVNENTETDLRDGSWEETVQKALAGTHKDRLTGEIVAAITKSAVQPTLEGAISRAEATNGLGPIRLRSMGANAPASDLRTVERVVHAIDGAFNEEALAARSSGA